ncbi:hypothetical protein E2562_039503 [Oryza meyeriana var. granulata]|uniref:DUF834 domain-containing protein n=1 Tax=Oryza meyeriana var. granulata TaxID=110450 RepID=A0A6G1DUV0_9ORYZ|nr:hypothetical protein E2562_039503 [Oryza meyeriana var. granulata]
MAMMPLLVLSGAVESVAREPDPVAPELHQGGSSTTNDGGCRSGWRVKGGWHLERSVSGQALDEGGNRDDDDWAPKRPRVPALARWV